VNDLGTITIGIGIIISMFYDWRTGFGSGGLISAGTLALTLYSPLRVLVCIAVSLLIWPVLDFCVKHWGLHGRTRIGMAMVMAIGLRLIIGNFVQPVPWVGWVIPGLIAADIQRQGAFATLCALSSVTVLTSFMSQWLFRFESVL
jgi:poly-gamma-glutamate biosynthesis protein PgsC/CapC